MNRYANVIDCYSHLSPCHDFVILNLKNVQLLFPFVFLFIHTDVIFLPSEIILYDMMSLYVGIGTGRW